MIKTLRIYRPLIIILAIVIGCILLTIFNLQFAKGDTGGGRDFYSYWLGTQSIFNNGQSPYSAETTQDIQTIIYGRSAVEGENGFEFSLPLYSILLFLPFAIIKDFIIARALWMTLLEISIIITILVCLKITNWKISPIVFVALILFAFFGFHGIMPLLNGGVVIITTLLMTVILAAIQKKHDETAGILLAFVTIFPSGVILFLIYLIFWAISNQRTKILAWFLGSIGLLIGFSIALIPTWMIQFLRNFILSYKAIDPGSPGGVLATRWGEIGGRLSIIIAVLIGLVLIVEWWLGSKKDQKLFSWTAMLTIALSAWSGIKISPVNYVVLYPALIFGLALISKRWKHRGDGIVLSILAFLFFGNWGIYFLTTSVSLNGEISSFLLIPMPLITLCLLYWSRWWVSKSSKVEFEQPLIETNKL